MRRADAFLIIVITALIFSACAGPSGGTEVGNPDPNTDVAKPQTFRSQAYGVDITHPYEWQVVELDQTEVHFLPPSNTPEAEAVAYFVESEDPISELLLLAGQSKPDQTATAYAAPGFNQGFVVVDALTRRTTLYLAADFFVVILEVSSLDGFSVANVGGGSATPSKETWTAIADQYEDSQNFQNSLATDAAAGHIVSEAMCTNCFIIGN